MTAGPAEGRRYLLPVEQRVIAVRRHPALLLRYFVETLVALVVAGLLTADLPDGNLIGTLLWLAALAVAARFGWKIAEWSVDRFVVTERRVLLVSGLLTRRVAMMPLRKVTDMTFERSLAGRLLGYGAFVMESAGQDQALHRIDYLPAPETLYLDVAELIFGVPPSAQVVDDDDLAPMGRTEEVVAEPAAPAPTPPPLAGTRVVPPAAEVPEDEDPPTDPGLPRVQPPSSRPGEDRAGPS